jgi:hypothetical protein
MDSIIGVTEKEGSYQEALRKIGQQDEDGQTIGIVYVTSSGVFRFFPTFFRTLGLLFVLSLYSLHQPLSFLPIDALANWDVVSLTTWGTAVVLYLLYFAFSMVKDNLYTGQPGAEIHFMKHEKVVKTLRPGEWTFVLDPRVSPYAVVSTKLMVLEMPEITGNTSENITQSTAGASDARERHYRLIERGGFGKFLRQLSEVYESVIKDEVLEIDARAFNQFMVEQVAVPDIEEESVTERLDNLESSNLSLDFLTEASQIEEIDISQFDLEESENPDRRRILPRLQRLGSEYGIEILDHIPVGNLTSGDYLRTLALPLVSSITRLRQATETLREITEEEIDEEIQARVAKLKLAVGETDRVLREIRSMMETLRDPENKEAIMEARETAIENAAQEEIASAMSLIESLQAQIRAQEMSTIGAIERFNSEWEQILGELEEKLEEYVPEVRSVVVDGVNEDIIPGVDVVERVLKDTGTLDQLEDLLDSEIDGAFDEDEMAAIIEEIESKAEEVDVDRIMTRLEDALEEISSESEISTDRFALENVEERLHRISESAEGSIEVEE